MALVISGYTVVQHKLVQRPYGATCQFTVIDSKGNYIDEEIKVTSMVISDSDLGTIVSAWLARRASLIAYEASLINTFHLLSPEIFQIVVWVVQQIRTNPGATLAQAQAAWTTKWGNSIFSCNNFIAYVQNSVPGVTWADFKTFVINNKFRGID
jgi:hypothetical protein